METIFTVFVVVGIVYFLSKPIDKKGKKKTPSKKFGEGLLQDSNAHDWWKPGDGGV